MKYFWFQVSSFLKSTKEEEKNLVKKFQFAAKWSIDIGGTCLVLGSKARVKNLAQTNWGSGQANMSLNKGCVFGFRRDLNNLLVHGELRLGP